MKGGNGENFEQVLKHLSDLPTTLVLAQTRHPLGERNGWGPITSEARPGDSKKVLEALCGLAEQEARYTQLKATRDHYKKLRKEAFNK